MTDEMKARLCEGRKKRAYHPVSAETKAKLSAARKGKKFAPLTPEHRAAIGDGNLGRRQSQETKQRIAAAQRRAWLRDGHKEKVQTSEARAKRAVSVSIARKGRKASESEREANRAAQKRLWDSYTPEEWEARTAKLRPRSARFFNTSIEMAVAAALTELGIEHRHNCRIGRFQVDFIVPTLCLVIECDGDYWHSLPGQVVKDRQKDVYITERGYRIARLKEFEIKADAVGCTRREIEYARRLGKTVEYLE